MEDIYVDIRMYDVFKEYYPNKDLITIGDMIYVAEDLKSKLEHLKEEYEDFQRDVEDNYKHIPYSSQIGYDERDFYEN